MNFTNLFSINLLAKTIIIEEVAQAKRSDGGVLKVEQPGVPLAVEEFIKGDNSFGSLVGAIQTENGKVKTGPLIP